MKKTLNTLLGIFVALLVLPAQSAEYRIDPAHSFIDFRIQHLGYSWLYGRFNTIKGTLDYDSDNPNAAKVDIDIDPASIDTNHAERDKHLRSGDFLDVKAFPDASFKSSQFKASKTGGKLEGMLSIHGVSKAVTITVNKIGEGSDPWGGHRVGFEGLLNLDRSQFDLGYNLGPSGEIIEFRLGIEAVQK